MQVGQPGPFFSFKNESVFGVFSFFSGGKEENWTVQWELFALMTLTKLFYDLLCLVLLKTFMFGLP